MNERTRGDKWALFGGPLWRALNELGFHTVVRMGARGEWAIMRKGEDK